MTPGDVIFLCCHQCLQGVDVVDSLVLSCLVRPPVGIQIAEVAQHELQGLVPLPPSILNLTVDCQIFVTISVAHSVWRSLFGFGVFPVLTPCMFGLGKLGTS